MAKRITRVLLAIAILVATAATTDGLRSLSTDPTTSPTTSSSTHVCSAIPDGDEVKKGLDLVTDASCKNGGEGCLGSICRYCVSKETNVTKELSYPRCDKFKVELSPEAAKTTGSDSTSGKVSNVTEFTVGMIMAGAGAVCLAMLVAVKVIQRRRRDREMMTTPTSLAHYRASVFEI